MSRLHYQLVLHILTPLYKAAKLKKCKIIIGVDRVAGRLELARELGATHVLNTSDAGIDLVAAVKELTNGDGVDITMDTTGVVALLQAGIGFTANFGKLLVTGIAPTGAELPVPLNDFMAVSRNRSLFKTSMVSYTFGLLTPTP
jgi:Zn-dependent alcohol dehydrogenase